MIGTYHSGSIGDGIAADGTLTKHIMYGAEYYSSNTGLTNYTETGQADSNTVGGIELKFLSNGFSVSGVSERVNKIDKVYTAYTFRKAENFFDVVTWTGDGTDARSLSHNLKSKPGMIWSKNLTDSGDHFRVYHRAATYEVAGTQRSVSYTHLRAHET